MKARLKCEKPEEIEFTMTITATAAEFERVRNELQKTIPGHTLTYQINDLLSQARKIYWSDDQEKKNGN